MDFGARQPFFLAASIIRRNKPEYGVFQRVEQPHSVLPALRPRASPYTLGPSHSSATAVIISVSANPSLHGL